jgi:hypothetical protein
MTLGDLKHLVSQMAPEVRSEGDKRMRRNKRFSDFHPRHF